MQINHHFPSLNCSNRTKSIEYIIMHYTEVPFDDAIDMLTSKAAQVSSHYLIKEDGEIFQLVEDDDIAWHAGQSSWLAQEHLNQNSIGIELDNLGSCKFAQEQMESCIELCKLLAKKYEIPDKNFIGHSDIAPDRKIDPGIFFDWELCAKNGLGIWHDLHPQKESELMFNFGDKSDDIKDLQHRLSLLGYAITATATFDIQTNFVVRAFLSKFCPSTIHAKGLEYYNNDKSKYHWDSFANSALNKLLLNRS